MPHGMPAPESAGSNTGGKIIMPNPNVTRTGRTINLNGIGNLTPSQASTLAADLAAAANAANRVPIFGPIPGTMTVKAAVSSKQGNNVLHGVTKVVVSGGRVYCYLADGTQPKYQDGSQHRSFGARVMATKGPNAGIWKTFSVSWV